jgi:hypothetical protein
MHLLIYSCLSAMDLLHTHHTIRQLNTFPQTSSFQRLDDLTAEVYCLIRSLATLDTVAHITHRSLHINATSAPVEALATDTSVLYPVAPCSRSTSFSSAHNMTEAEGQYCTYRSAVPCRGKDNLISLSFAIPLIVVCKA